MTSAECQRSSETVHGGTAEILERSRTLSAGKWTCNRLILGGERPLVL